MFLTALVLMLLHTEYTTITKVEHLNQGLVIKITRDIHSSISTFVYFRMSHSYGWLVITRQDYNANPTISPYAVLWT